MENLILQISHNLENILERIERAAASSGRNSKQIKLVIVTKSRSIELVSAAVASGAHILGENYPEESLIKIQTLGTVEAVEWHMIGHLQKRKVSIVADHFDMIQSIDRYSIAAKLNEKLTILGRKMPILLEFNVGGEETKFGWQANEETSWNNLLPEIEQIIDLSNLDVRGLMTMPPLASTSEESRRHFKKLKNLQDFLNTNIQHSNWNELSMGTSNDFEIAVQEGATYVRIGHAIFSPGSQQCSK